MLVQWFPLRTPRSGGITHPLAAPGSATPERVRPRGAVVQALPGLRHRGGRPGHEGGGALPPARRALRDDGEHDQRAVPGDLEVHRLLAVVSGHRKNCRPAVDFERFPFVYQATTPARRKP